MIVLKFIILEKTLDRHNSSYRNPPEVRLSMLRDTYIDNIFRMRQLLIIPVVYKFLKKLKVLQFLNIIFTQSRIGQAKKFMVWGRQAVNRQI